LILYSVVLPTLNFIYEQYLFKKDAI
jgi:hypothetical protein